MRCCVDIRVRRYAEPLKPSSSSPCPSLPPPQNPEKLAASKKAPLVARYVHGKIAYVRSDSQQ